ncbi:serine hydrolase domain-containing protein [Amycolatopsis suaedae]|uniref:Class A beta-lactamase-related serine hydrolase n=1 Tax=Amycolatopsis suaedae TaxID=2510978 RepID=A0A4Q7J977_9PSEU|nr:serine hydrolase domain-containing protein [Amycolatopsis suaedae]RZQ63777.1 class A beta-lactamase-related serine hydrolase [Amycolatopsis suaedae]
MTGWVAPGFEPVRAVFDDVLAATTGGAAFCVYRRGKPVADLWGGFAEPGRPWEAGTPVVLFSGTKGLVAAVVAALGLDPDAPVARFWPGFAPDVRLHHVLAHTAGLPYVEAGGIDVLDNAANAAALATQSPLWTPGERVAYHAVTYGYLLTELVRRAGHDLGTLVSELDPEVWLGTPPSVDNRVARLVRAPGYRVGTFVTDPAKRAVIDRMYGGLLAGDLINTVAYRRAGLAAGGGVGTARAMARVYDRLLAGGPAVARATRTWSEGVDAIADRPLRFGLGFELADPIGTYGPAEEAFGHSGAGGGRHGAWPAAGLAFSFCTNEMVAEDADTRAARLLAALYACA